jgi:hypothetical protein
VSGVRCQERKGDKGKRLEAKKEVQTFQTKIKVYFLEFVISISIKIYPFLFMPRTSNLKPNAFDVITADYPIFPDT